MNDNINYEYQKIPWSILWTKLLHSTEQEVVGGTLESLKELSIFPE